MLVRLCLYLCLGACARTFACLCKLCCVVHAFARNSGTSRFLLEVNYSSHLHAVLVCVCMCLYACAYMHVLVAYMYALAALCAMHEIMIIRATLHKDNVAGTCACMIVNVCVV